jgi:hypothetical protein
MNMARSSCLANAPALCRIGLDVHLRLNLSGHLIGLGLRHACHHHHLPASTSA